MKLYVRACLTQRRCVCVYVCDFFNSAMLTDAPEKKTGIGSAKSKIRMPSRTYRGVRAIREISDIEIPRKSVRDSISEIKTSHASSLRPRILVSEAQERRTSGLPRLDHYFIAFIEP